MSKKVCVLGIEIDNHTARENMFLLDEYVSSDGLNVVGVVLAEHLLLAAEDPSFKAVLDEMDLCIIGDEVIFEVLPDTYEQQMGELQRRDLEELFLKSLMRRKKTVYWMSDNESDLPVMEEYRRENYADLIVAGTFTGDLTEDTIDACINELNSIAPDVLICQTASAAKLELLMQHKNLLNVKMCLCIGYRMKTKYWSPNRNSKIKTLLDQTMFKRKAMKYQSEMEQ